MPRQSNSHGRNAKKNFKHNNGKPVHKGGVAGRGGRGGGVKKPYSAEHDKFKKFKHIQRNQAAEETLRQRKQMELQQQQQQYKNEELESSSDEEETNPFEQLLSSFQATKNLSSKKTSAIDSSDSEMDEEGSDDDDEVDEDDELDSDEDDTDECDTDIPINEQFEEQDDRRKEILKKYVKDVDDMDVKINEDEPESDSSDEDEETVLRPEESTSKKLDATQDYVAYASDDENEEEPYDDIDIDENTEEASSSDLRDIFSVHLDNELSTDLLECVSTTHSSLKHELNWPKLGRLHVEIPSAVLECAEKSNGKHKKRILLDADICYAREGTVPKKLGVQAEHLSEYGIKSQMYPHVAEANKANISSADTNGIQLLTDLQTELFSIMNNYQDLYYPSRTHENGEEVRFTYCMHALNHILKTRTKILNHNAKISRDSANAKAPDILPDSYRDQGLFRPKVLIVVPFRESALRVVKMLISLIFPDLGGKVMHYNRFLEEFGGEGLYFPKRNPKPEDYEKTFAGNSDDTFRLGICLTRKCMKLYSDFYTSDLLIVSPLGLRMIVGAPGEKERDYDFLASIELLILDQADLFVAQNWDHLLHVLDHLHLQPQSARNTDFSRVRSWCLNGWTRFYRQNMLFTSHELPEFRSLFNSRCCNYRGKIRIANPITSGTIRHVAVQVAQLFHRVEVTSIQTSFDQRFNHFVNKILPQYKGASMAHCLILVPSYFDFVRLRNYFKKECLNFVQICEYTKDAKIARSRDMFFHSGAHFMLYSERAHFFRRTRVKGIRHLIMYQPPTWPNFYPEMINLMQEANQNPRDGGENSMTVTVLYTKYDMLQVTSIIGTDRALKMSTSDKSTHMFMTGE